MPFETDLRTGGPFVEFGAHDGTTHNNTRLLEERFCSVGVLAEPGCGGDTVGLPIGSVDTRCV